ncbi:EamA family transporter [Actinoallomurus iriomotensis]|uniref:Drug/metabolite exporter YedA n=1 Tax=Actinoallomurus iriomotensis TaxID=478107 RepID=A0A9W6SDR8_9ACTN|nr:EamA family transporter [Actinoallomurus iriomotensis]GLY90842.1 drug/metabolite exporter YedA [Actinoallomurus iriomotensis]
MSSQTADNRSSLVWVALSIVYVVWGSTYLGIHYLVQTIPPMVGAGLRFVVAAVLLAAVLAIRSGPRVLRVPWRRLGTAALAGVLLLTGGNGMIGVAEQHMSTGLAALLVASVPLWLVVFRWVTGDRPAVSTIAGVLVGFGGLALLTLTRGGGSGSALGVAIVLGAALSWSVGSFLSARMPMPANPFVASVYEMAAAGVTLLAVGFGRGERFHPHEVSQASWLGLAYLVTFGSLIAFTSYVWLLGNAPISLVGTYAYVNPAVAVLLGVAFAGENATWTIVAGGLIIILGVGLVVSTERRPRGEVTAPVPPGTPRRRRERRRSPRVSRSTPGRPRRRTGVR